MHPIGARAEREKGRDEARDMRKERGAGPSERDIVRLTRKLAEVWLEHLYAWHACVWEQGWGRASG